MVVADDHEELRRTYKQWEQKTSETLPEDHDARKDKDGKWIAGLLDCIVSCRGGFKQQPSLSCAWCIT